MPAGTWWPRRRRSGAAASPGPGQFDGGRWRIQEILPGGRDRRQPPVSRSLPATHGRALGQRGMLPPEPGLGQHGGLHPLAGQQEFIGQLAHDQPQHRRGNPEEGRPVECCGQPATRALTSAVSGAQTLTGPPAGTSAGTAKAADTSGSVIQGQYCRPLPSGPPTPSRSSGSSRAQRASGPAEDHAGPGRDHPDAGRRPVCGGFPLDADPGHDAAAVRGVLAKHGGPAVAVIVRSRTG